LIDVRAQKWPSGAYSNAYGTNFPAIHYWRGLGDQAIGIAAKEEALGNSPFRAGLDPVNAK
jgi:hypothetical protein